MKQKVAIQGILGAFHEEAAVNYYAEEEIEIIPCTTFSELVFSVESNLADSGIIAIENTIAGSILPNYALIENSDLNINGEIYLRIVQNLIANKGVKLEDVKKVYSHPMAIYQCSEFFRNLPDIQLVESFDTAISAKEIADSGSKNKAAIAGKFAAKKYDLQILAESIENNKLNYTRFIEIRKSKTSEKNVNKSSICFSLSHKSGSLSSVLSVLAFYEMNLNKIQSHPILGKPWEYNFYVDLIFDDFDRYKQSINAILPLTSNFKIMGEYKEGNKSFSKQYQTHTTI